MLSEETVAIDAERRLRELAAERPGTEAFLIQLHPRVAALLAGGPGPAAARDRGRDRQALPLRGLRGAADRPLRGGRWRARSEEVEERALPFQRGRGGARDHRGAAHVRRGRRRGQARRLRDLGGRRRASWWARRRSCGSRTWAAPPPRPCWSRAPTWCPRRPTARAAARARPANGAPPGRAARRRGGGGRRRKESRERRGRRGRRTGPAQIAKRLAALALGSSPVAGVRRGQVRRWPPVANTDEKVCDNATDKFLRPSAVPGAVQSRRRTTARPSPGRCTVHGDRPPRC